MLQMFCTGRIGCSSNSASIVIVKLLRLKMNLIAVNVSTFQCIVLFAN